MALIRKNHAGSDSFGHHWGKDGAVVEIDDPDQIAALLAIPDGGFAEVTPGSDSKGGDEAEKVTVAPTTPPGAPAEFSEVDPKNVTSVDNPSAVSLTPGSGPIGREVSGGEAVPPVPEAKDADAEDAPAPKRGGRRPAAGKSE